MNTCARRASSLSITARSCRYWGSGAVMMSELVAASAWICPPVEDWLALVLELVAPGAAPAPVGAAADIGAERASPLRAARKVAASLTASAFFR